MTTTKQKISSFQYTWIKPMPLFRSYLFDLGESLRADLKKELESKTPNESAIKEMTDALKVVINLLGTVTDMMRLFFGEESLKELPTVRYPKNNNPRRPYVRRGNWGGSRPNSGRNKNNKAAAAEAAPEVSEERAAIAAFDSLLSAVKPATVSSEAPERAKPAKRASLITPIKKKKKVTRKAKKTRTPASTPAPTPEPSTSTSTPALAVKVPTLAEAMKEIEARFDAMLDQATWGGRPAKED